MTARALSLLAAFASPVFMAAAIAGWLYGFLPATPLTFGIAAVLVIGGPMVGIVHVATSKEYDYDEEELETVVLAPPPMPVEIHRLPASPIELTPRAAAAQRFAAWRDSPPSPTSQPRA